MSDLCTLADVKAALNIPTLTTAKDTMLGGLIADASAWIERHCQRTFASTSYTEYFSPGSDRRVFRLNTIRPRQYPIISVTSLHEDADRLYAAASLIAAADYFLTPDGFGVQLFDDGSAIVFDPGQRTVKLVYVAGYAAIPADLDRAAVMLVVHLYYSADRQKQGLASESMGSTTVVYKDETMPKEVLAIIDLYRRPCGL